MTASIYILRKFASHALLVLASLHSLSTIAAAKPLVLVSIPPQAFFVSRIAGDQVEVQAMLPAGVNHETFEPKMKQLRAFSNAALYIKLGHPAFTFESLWIDQLLAGNPTLKVVNSSEKIKYAADDFHLWTAPDNAALIAAEIGAALKTLLPDQPEIEIRTQALLDEITQLDKALTEQLKPFPSCAFLSFHPAWSYFARRYNLIQLAVEVEGKEPGMLGIAKLLADAKARHIKTFIVEPSSSQEMSRNIGKELQVEPKTIDPLAEDWLGNTSGLGKYLAENLRGCTAH